MTVKTNRHLIGWRTCVCTVLVVFAATLQGAPPKPPRPPVPTDPFVISTDTAIYGTRVSQQIPAIARVGTRWFCIWYGVNKGERGISGKDTGCYNTLALSSDGGETWPHYYVFDDRKDPGTSYPNIQFGADAQGNYDGMIYVAYDHGRGKKPPAYNKEITIAVIPENSIAEGKPTSTRYIVSK